MRGKRKGAERMGVGLRAHEVLRVFCTGGMKSPGPGGTSATALGKSVLR